MDRYGYWPGQDEAPPIIPVILPSVRPGQNRRRLNTAHNVAPRQYYTPDGQLLVPADGGSGMHRSSSVSGGRPAQVIINNDYEVEGRRPRSVHYYDYEDRGRAKSQSRTRHRRHSRTPSPHYELDYETREKMKKLEELEKKQEAVKVEKRLKEKMLLEEARRREEEAEREKEHKQLKKIAIEEYKAKEEKEKAKKKKEKEEAEEEFQERLRKTLWSNGYTDTRINQILKKGEKREGGGLGAGESSNVLALSRPTYIKVRRKHLDPETLNLYQLPWEWDVEDDSFIIIKQWIPERDQDILFEHTRKLREGKQLTYTTTELRKERDKLLLVKKKDTRKKSPARTWLLS